VVFVSGEAGVGKSRLVGEIVTAARESGVQVLFGRGVQADVPVPFRPFKEPVVYAARRQRGEGWRFKWASETVHFRTRRDVIRFLYCHEWMHWYLHEVLGKASSAETACDRFALRNFRRRMVTTADANAALRRRPRALAVGAVRSLSA